MATALKIESEVYSIRRQEAGPPRRQRTYKRGHQVNNRRDTRYAKYKRTGQDTLPHSLILAFLPGAFLPGKNCADLWSMDANSHVWRHLQRHNCFPYVDHLTVNSPGGHHLVVLFQFVQQVLVLFTFFLLRANHHEIHNDKDQNERDERHHRPRPARARQSLRIYSVEHLSS